MSATPLSVLSPKKPPPSPLVRVPTWQIIDGQYMESREDAFLQQLLKLADEICTNIRPQWIKWVRSQNEKPSPIFLEKSEIHQLDPNLENFIKKIHEMVLQKFSLAGYSKQVELFCQSNQLCIQSHDLEKIISAPNELKRVFTKGWESLFTNSLSESILSTSSQDGEILEKIEFPDTIPALVEKFNEDPERRNLYRQEALSRLRTLKKKNWKFEEGLPKIPRGKNVTATRQGLIQMYRCSDPIVKEQVLNDLIEILDCDPLKMETADDLVELQEKLYEEVKATNSQNINTHKQRLLIKAYAISLECILLHTAAGHLNALTEETKEKIWNGAEDIKNSNTSKDKEIKFWAEYAIQGAQRIRTSTSELMAWLSRVASLAKAGIQLATIAYKPEEVTMLLEGAVCDLQEAAHHIERHESWFEEVLALKKYCRYSLYDATKFSDIVTILQNRKGKVQSRKGVEPNLKLLYGITTVLEYTVMNSPSKNIQEEGIILLLQYYSIDNPEIKSRIISAFVEMLKSKNLRLRGTAYLVLKFLQALKKGRQDRGGLSDNVLLRIEDIAIDELFPKGKNVSKENILLNVIKFLIWHFAEIREEEEYGSQSLLTLLSFSKKVEVIPYFLEVITALPKEFKGANKDGNTAYHIAVLQGNNSILEHIKEEKGLDVNAQEKKELNTALHIACKKGRLDMVSYLIESCKADPNLVNSGGNTPLHFAVEYGHIEIVKKLLELKADDNNDNYKVDVNRNNNIGNTALNIAIENDCVEMVQLLQKRGGRVSQEVHKISPIIIAAQRNAERVLEYLASKKEESLDPLEELEIVKMETRDLDTSAKILGENHEITRDISGKYQVRSSLSFKTKNKLILTGGSNRKKGLTKSTPFSDNKRISLRRRIRSVPQLHSVDEIGNTNLIHLLTQGEGNDKLKECITENPSLVNESNNFGVTPLHTAVITGNLNAVGILLKNGAKVDEVDMRGNTPLHFAVFLHNFDLVEKLLQAGANASQQNQYGETPLLLHCGHFPERAIKTIDSVTSLSGCQISHENDIKIFETLVAYGALPDEKDSMNNNVLHHAVIDGSDELLKYLLLNHPKLFWEKNNKGYLPIQEKDPRSGMMIRALMPVENELNIKKLHDDFIEKTKNRVTLGNLLAHEGEAELFKTLVSSDPSCASHPDSTERREIPLHVAAREGKLEILGVYLEKELEIELKDIDENSPQHLAAENNRKEFLKALINAGVDLTAQNSDRRTSLHIAAVGNHKECVKVLIGSCPELIRICDGNRNTALHLACKEGAEDVVAVLCQMYGESMNEMVNGNGSTCLHLACAKGDVEIIRLLIKAGANPESKGPFGNTPLLIAAQKGNVEAVRELAKNKQRILDVNNEGETALHQAIFRAVSQQHLEVIRLLLKKNQKMNLPKDESLLHKVDYSNETALLELTKKKENSSEKGEEQENIEKDILDLLIDYGVDLEHFNNLGENFLHLICLNGLGHLLDHIIAKSTGLGKTLSIDYYATDNRNNQAIHQACLGNHLNIVEKLINARVRIHGKNKDGMNPTLLAASLGRWAIVGRLLEARAHICSKDKAGRTVLHHILHSKELNEEAVGLINQIFDKYKGKSLLNKKDKQRNRPLHVLAENGNHIDVFNIMLKHMPSDDDEKQKLLWKRNKNKKNAYQIATGNKFNDLAQAILNYRKKKATAVALPD